MERRTSPERLREIAERNPDELRVVLAFDDDLGFTTPGDLLEEIGRLRRGLGDVVAKAALGAKVCRDGHPEVAGGFDVVRDHAQAVLGGTGSWDGGSPGIHELAARIAKLEDGLRATLLFHRGGAWTPADDAEWDRLAGARNDPSTRGLCDLCRELLDPPDA